MARYKRYFPVSHDLFDDPEVDELCRTFRLGGLRMWLKILSILDQNDNTLKVDSYVLRKLSVVSGQRLANAQQTLNFFVAKRWLVRSENSENTYRSPNYALYHRMRAPKVDNVAKNSSQIAVPPKLPNLNIPKEEKKELPCEGSPSRQVAEELLNFLNQKTGRSYRAYEGTNGKRKPTASLDFILGCLKRGHTEQEIRGVIARKCRQWKGDAKMDKFLRPATLFNRTNFDQYLGEKEANPDEMP